MSEAAKAELIRINAEIDCIDSILASCKEAAVKLRRTRHLPHLHYPAGVLEMMHSVELTRDGLVARRTKVECFMGRPVLWGQVIPLRKES